jgi:hypothetical protein
MTFCRNCSGLQVPQMDRQCRLLRYRLRSAFLVFLLFGALFGTDKAISESAWWNGGVRPIKFDPVTWQRADEIGNYRTVRSEMIGDLLKKYDFRGWSRKSLTDLLGKPDWDSNTTGFASWDTAYHLGLERGGSFSVDDECLVFRFDKNDRVVSYMTAVN